MSKAKSLYNLILLFFTVFLVLLTVTLWYWEISLLWVLLPISAFLGFLVVASAKLELGIYMPVISKFSQKQNCVALTFDDGPSPENTLAILSVLNSYNAKATFFLIGEKVEKHPEIVKQIIDAGHEIANHSYSHSYMFPWFSAKKIQTELLKTCDLVRKISGEEPKYFRPPFGVSNPNIAKAVKNTGLKTIGWSVRSLDTVKSPKTVLKRLSKTKSGDIILLHDNRPDTVKILEKFLRSYKNKGINFCSVSKCLDAEK